MGGLSAAGFTKETTDSVLTLIENDQKSKIGPQINLNTGSLFSILNGIFADRLASLWDLAGEIHASKFPNSAVGAQFDEVLSQNGLERIGAKPSKVTTSTLLAAGAQLFFGTAGTEILHGTQVSVTGSPSSTFVTDEDITLVTGVNEVQEITFIGTPASGGITITLRSGTTALIPWNAIAVDVAAALNAMPGCSGCFSATGTYAGGFIVTFQSLQGKQPQPLLTVDTTALFTSLSVEVTASVARNTTGVAQGATTMTCLTNGPVGASAGTLVNLVTPISGVTRTINVDDAVLGSNKETDSAGRIRRSNQLQAFGSSTTGALRSALLNVVGVTSVEIVVNDEDVADGDGRPAHSFECYIAGGSDSDIAETIWAKKPIGIRSDGSVTTTTVDAAGVTQTVRYSRPTQVDIYMAVTVTTTGGTGYPTDGNDLVKAALCNYINALGQGVSIVVRPKLESALAAIPGIENVAINIGTAPTPVTSVNIPISGTEFANAQTTNCAVTTV